MNLPAALWVPLGLKQNHEWESSVENQESDADSKDDSTAYTLSATSALSSSRTTLDALITTPTSATSAGSRLTSASNQQTGNPIAASGSSGATQSSAANYKSGQNFPAVVGGFLIAISIILSIGIVIIILLFRRRRRRQKNLLNEKPLAAASVTTWSSIWGSRTPNTARSDVSQSLSFKRGTAFTSYSLPVGAEASNYVTEGSYHASPTPPIPLTLSHPPAVSRFSGTTQTSASVVEPGSDPFRDFHPVREASIRFSRINPKNRT